MSFGKPRNLGEVQKPKVMRTDIKYLHRPEQSALTKFTPIGLVPVHRVYIGEAENHTFPNVFWETSEDEVRKSFMHDWWTMSKHCTAIVAPYLWWKASEEEEEDDLEDDDPSIWHKIRFSSNY